MVRRHLRTRTRKKVKVRTPGGKTTTHFKRKKPGKATCGRCKKNLGGVPNKIPSENRALKSSQRTPSRPYAGVLCSNCLDNLVRYATRMEVKYSNPDYKNLEVQRDLTLEKYLPRGWHARVEGGEISKERVLEKKAKKTKPEKKKLEAKKGKKKK